MYNGLHVKCPLLCQILKKLEFSRQILEKYLNTNFHENVQWEPNCTVRKGTHYEPNSQVLKFYECASRQMLATGWPVLRHYFDKSNPAYVIV